MVEGWSPVGKGQGEDTQRSMQTRHTGEEGGERREEGGGWSERRGKRKEDGRHKEGGTVL